MELAEEIKNLETTVDELLEELEERKERIKELEDIIDEASYYLNKK
jgi:tetrahydromethanopterin S-methyltransferase subunit B